MKQVGKMTITLPSDREIAMSREFNAPKHLVFDAYTKPELVKRWLGVRAGWTFAVCEIDLRVGGAYRFVWQNTSGYKMGMGGVYTEIKKPDRVASSEKFDDPWYEGEATSSVEFVENAGKTTLIMTVVYANKAVRDQVLKSPMDSGVAEGFDTLERLLRELEAKS